MLVLEAAARQLKELESQLLASNPKLENHLALYLQVLRDGLLAVEDQFEAEVASFGFDPAASASR